MTTLQSLPPEVKEEIFSFLTSSTLQEIVMHVCQDWRDLGERMIEERISKMDKYFDGHANYFREVRNLLPLSSRDDKKRLLNVYEGSLLGSKVTIETEPLRKKGLHFLAKVTNSRNCDCLKKKCIVKALHFMPCYHLILLQLPEKMEFYNLDLLSNSPVGEEVDAKTLRTQLEPYKTSILGVTSRNNVYLDNNVHNTVSVYDDTIVGQVTTRVLVLFKVSDVDHTARGIVLEEIRRIFLPFWCCDLILLHDRVCMIYTTGDVGVLRLNHVPEPVHVLGGKCADVGTMRDMQSSNLMCWDKWVIIKVETTTAVHWAIFDAFDDELTCEILRIDFGRLVSNVLIPEPHEGHKIMDILLIMNMLILHYEADDDDPSTQSKEQHKSHGTLLVTNQRKQRRIICKRIKSSPDKEDFSSPSKFSSLFYKRQYVIPAASAHSATSPLLVLPHCMNSSTEVTNCYAVACVVGLSKCSLLIKTPVDNMQAVTYLIKN